MTKGPLIFSIPLSDQIKMPAKQMKEFKSPIMLTPTNDKLRTIDGARNIMMIILFVAQVSLVMYLLHYLQQLETIGCKCALGWRRDFIRVYLTYSITVNSILMACMLLNGPAFFQFVHNNAAIFSTISLVHLALNIVNVVIMLQYVSDLQKKKCECSEGTARTVMLVMSIVVAALYAFSAVQILVVMIFGWLAMISLK